MLSRERPTNGRIAGGPLKIIVAAAALLCASAIVAHADTFTISGTGQIQNQVTATGTDGKPIGALYGTSTGQQTYASGMRTPLKGQCVQWSAAPGTGFTTDGICMGSDSMGTYSLVFGCLGDAKGAVADCWGGLQGTGGGYANKTGTESWHSTLSADQKTISFNGVGMWN